MFINEIPLKLFGSLMEPFLCNGHMILLPQSSGILPEVKMLLKTIVKYGIVSSVVHYKILQEYHLVQEIYWCVNDQYFALLPHLL